jgi:hypothetical protein
MLKEAEFPATPCHDNILLSLCAHKYAILATAHFALF